MKLLASFFLLSVASLAHAASPLAFTGTWQGAATVHGKQVPLTLSISGSGSNLKAALLNGPEQAQASSVTLDGNHLVVAFNYYARKFDATLADGTLSGTFGTAAVHYPVSAKLAPKPSPPTPPPPPP